MFDSDFHGTSEAEKMRSMQNRTEVWTLTNRLQVPTIFRIKLVS